MNEEQELAIARSLMLILLNTPDYRQKDDKYLAISRMSSAFPTLSKERLEMIESEEE